jgi:glycosyltransferase involved in cell wall biosynthesis/MoaA/NifB/PqqE/SkfB family radical SAM enzyme
MRILKVIHGYPTRYNAGSEVYSQSLCRALATRHTVHVFTREENAFAQDFSLRVTHDADDPRITLHIVNNPRFKDRYRATGIDRRFAQVLERVKPDLVHVGHLNHLSTSLVEEAASRQIPIIYTLHDYWLMCPRGQFMQMFPENPADLWAACDVQEDRKCAERCYARYFSGAPEENEADVAHWSDWVRRRMKHVREMANLVDLFIAPARYLLDRYRTAFGLPECKLVYLDYGFPLKRLSGRRRADGEHFTFGYIGTHIPAKGIHDLIVAFGGLQGNARLRIWGRPNGQATESLKAIAASLPGHVADRIEWRPEYGNDHIVREVFNWCDAIVVPSVWVENSPLVIHEAQQARVPVITADAGGMAEYVHHEVNGLLYAHRSAIGLAAQMQRLVDDPALAARLGRRGYLFSESGNVPDISAHATAVVSLYQQVMQRHNYARVPRRTGPWRITFDTNPDTCNLTCLMCEEHSPYSSLQNRRKAEGRPRRLMPFEMIERTVSDAAPHGLREIIPSTMGEPLLYEHFEDILTICDRYGVKLNLTTNGTFPRLGAKRWAHLIVPVGADIKISWNAATKATHEAIMRGSRWESAIDNVRTFVAIRDEFAAAGGNRCRVTFQLTFLESNLRELANIVRLAVSLGIDRVKGHHLWVHFEELQGESMRRSPASIDRWNAAVQAAKDAAAEQLLPNGKQILLENFFMLHAAATDDIAPGRRCPFLGQEAWVSACGRFDPCCAPDAQRRSLGEFGTLHDQAIMDIWNGKAYRELLENHHTRSLCLRCNMRKPAGAER